MKKKRSSKKTSKPTRKPSAGKPEKSTKSKKVTGSVVRIVGGKPTNIILTAAGAFRDLEQAREQVLYAEKHGSPEEKRLVRLAFSQYQKKRFRAK